MTTPGNSLIEQLAAGIFGQPTGDPFQDAMRTAVLNGVACVAEMNATGFDTNNLFDHDYLKATLDPRRPFTITSAGKTGAVYLVVLTEQAGSAYRAAVQIYNPGQVNEKFYKMTLVCADNGSIRANPGW